MLADIKHMLNIGRKTGLCRIASRAAKAAGLKMGGATRYDAMIAARTSAAEMIAIDVPIAIVESDINKPALHDVVCDNIVNLLA